MRTRTRGDYWLRGLCVGALSAASMALLGLSLAQQSPTKLATADSPLSSSARTALGGPHDEDAAKSGSSDHGSMKMVVVTPDFSDSFENQAFENAGQNTRVACARYFAGRLNKGLVSQGKPPVHIDDHMRRRAESLLNAIPLTEEEQVMVYHTEDFDDWSSFNYQDPESEPMTEDEVVESKGCDELSYEKTVNTLFADLGYIVKRRFDELGESGTYWVDRPITMLALFRSEVFARLMVFTLPYMIDEIAAHFYFDADEYGFDMMKALPELQKKSPASISFTSVSATEDKLAYAEVRHDEEIVVTRNDKLKTELSQVSSTKELSQLIECLKQEAKISSAHELVVAYVELLDPTTDAETTVLCSDVGVLESLQNQLGNSDSDNKFGSNSEIICVDAIFVDREYSHLMKNHIVEVFNLMEEFKLLDSNLKARSASLLDEMKRGSEAVADNQ